MALFQGEDMFDVTTPDGRTLTLPRSAVPSSMLSQIVGAQPPSPGGTPAAGVIGAPPQPARPEFAQPTLPNPETAPTSTGVVEMGDPTTRRVTAQQVAKEQAAQKAAQIKADKAQAARAATPQGQLAGVQGKQNAAVQEQKDALLKQADVDAAEQDVLAGAVEQRNTHLDTLFADRAKDMQARATAEDAVVARNQALKKKIADKKIDRTFDHPVIMAIMAGLAGLGAAMQGQKVDTLDILNNAIDRKVAAQTADLDQMAKIYGMSKDDLADMRDSSKRKLEFHNMMISAETDKAVRTIEEITARSASAKTKANAQAMIAQLNARSADKLEEATRWGLDYDQKDKQHKAQIGLGYAGIAEQRRSNMANEQLKREDMYLDVQKALAADRAQGATETYKARLAAATDAQKTGVRDLNGDYFLTPEGKAKMAQAQQLEDEAKRTEEAYKNDPMGAGIKSQRVELLRQKASILRGDAQSLDVVKAHNDTEAVTVSNMVASGQSVVQLIDGIKALSDQVGRGVIRRTDAQVKLRAMFNQLKPGLKEAWQLGAWDKGSAQLVEKIIGADPTSEWDAGMLGMALAQKMYEDRDAFKGSLDSVAEDLERKAKNRLTTLGVKLSEGDTVLQRAKAVDTNTPVGTAMSDLTQARSGVELANARDLPPGVAEGLSNRDSLGRVYDKRDETANIAGIQQSEAPQSIKYPGLSKDQEAPFETALTAYKKGDRKAGDQLIAEIANTAKDRPDLAVPLLHTLKEHAPKLYSAARVALPKDSAADTQMSYEENNTIAAAPMATQDLTQMVISTMRDDGTITDEHDFKELSARAGRGDQEAKAAVMEIVRANNTKKTLPKGSVFRNGVR